MPAYEYKVVPAPKRGLKARGLKTGEARFANALQTVMNDLGAQGWEYQRTDTLPLEERQGLTGKTSTFQNMLVFRRTIESEAPMVAALIEDQSVSPAEADAPVADQDNTPLDDAAVAANDAETAPEPISAEDLIGDEDNAHARGNEALSSGFSFPWSARRSKQAATAKAEGDDPQVAAE